MKNSKLVLFLSMFILIVGSAVAQDRGEFRRGMMERRAEMQQDPMDRIPDLTEDQKAKLKEIRLEMKKQVLPLKNQIGEKEARLKTLTTADDADMKSIDKLIEEIGDIKTEIRKMRAATHQKVRAELNDEQRLFLDTRMGQHKRHMRMKRMHQEGR